MAPIIEVSDKTLKGLEQLGVDYKHYDPKSIEAPNVIISGRNGFVYVPSLNMDVSMERSYHGKNWNESHEALSQEDARMLTLPEFREFLKYAKENNSEVYEDITAVRNPWRAEWLDAFFEQRADGLYVLTGNKTRAEKLDDNTLMEDRTPGISLELWLGDSTKQGLPRANAKGGNLYYWKPRGGKVARFDADSGRSGLYCDGDPSGGDSCLGVRAAKPRD